MIRSSVFSVLGLTVIGAFLIAGCSTFMNAQTDEVDASRSATRDLQPLMVELALDMERINSGLWHGDYIMVARGASAIAEHPRITESQLQAIRRALGDEFEQFREIDEAVHEAAEEIADAAFDRDMAGVLENYRELQEGCLSCHAAFRSEVQQALYDGPMF